MGYEDNPLSPLIRGESDGNRFDGMGFIVKFTITYTLKFKQNATVTPLTRGAGGLSSDKCAFIFGCYYNP